MPFTDAPAGEDAAEHHPSEEPLSEWENTIVKGLANIILGLKIDKPIIPYKCQCQKPPEVPETLL